MEIARPLVQNARRELLAQGRGVTLREIIQRVPAEVLASVSNLLSVLKEIHADLRQEAAHDPATPVKSE